MLIPDWVWPALVALGGSVLAYAIGAGVHIYIDNREGKKLVARYFDTTKTQIVDPLKVELKAEIAELRDRIGEIQIPEMPSVDMAGQFEAFLRSESGKTWARELAELAATNFEEFFLAKTAAAAGAAAKRTQDSLAKILDGSLDFGNPILNGLWAQVPWDRKRSVYQRLARALRKAGLQVGPDPRAGAVDADFEDAGGDIPALDAPEDLSSGTAESLGYK